MNRIAIAALILGLVLCVFGFAQSPDSQTPPDGKPINGPDATYRLGGKVKAPRIISAPDPVYPNIKNVKGKVLLWLVVNEKGKTQDIKIAKSLQPDLDQAAIEAVKKWLFEPATLTGKPVKVQINVEVVFNRDSYH